MFIIRFIYRKQFEFDWKRAQPLPPMVPLYDKELKKRGLDAIE